MALAATLAAVVAAGFPAATTASTGWGHPQLIAKDVGGLGLPALNFTDSDQGLAIVEDPMGSALVFGVRPQQVPQRRVLKSRLAPALVGGFTAYGQSSVVALGETTTTQGRLTAVVQRGSIRSGLQRDVSLGVPGGQTVRRIVGSTTPAGTVGALITLQSVADPTRFELGVASSSPSGTTGRYVAVAPVSGPDVPRAVSVSDDGSVTAVWTDGGKIWVARRSVSSMAATPQPVAEGAAQAVAIASNSAGRSIIAWRTSASVQASMMDRTALVGPVRQIPEHLAVAGCPDAPGFAVTFGADGHALLAAAVTAGASIQITNYDLDDPNTVGRLHGADGACLAGLASRGKRSYELSYLRDSGAIYGARLSQATWAGTAMRLPRASASNEPPQLSVTGDGRGVAIWRQNTSAYLSFTR